MGGDRWRAASVTPVAVAVVMVVAMALVGGPPAGAAGSVRTTGSPHASALNATSGPCARATSAPGVTSTSITTGAIETRTGPLAGDFASLVYGVQAYFRYVNARGGINGRKLNLAYPLNDGGNPSEFTALAHTLVDQDHVFAVTGVASAFFSPTYFTQTCTPTYGYAVEYNWGGAPNLYAAGGSVVDNSANQTAINYVLKRLRARNVGVVAYGVSASNDACKAAAAGMAKAGIHVAYQNENVAYGSSLTPVVERMDQAHVGFVYSCMDITGNISMARAMQQYGMHPGQLWLSGADYSAIRQYRSLMQGVYFYLAHVPFAAATRYPGTYPGLQTYIATMNRYYPKYTYDEVAIQGWESAALFAAGVRAAGKDLTQQHLVAVTNAMTAFNAGGLIAPVNWASGGHYPPTTYPVCSAYAQVEGVTLVPRFGKGKQVFICFNKTPTRPVPVKAPPGTPGA